MKNSTYQFMSVLVNIFIVVLVFYSGLPLWTFLILIPLNVYLQIYAAQQFNFRESLQLADIPHTGYEKRISELNAFTPGLEELGFEKFDEFYLRTSNDLIAFAYRHRELPVILCNYHLETLVFCDLDTKFNNSFALTTCNSNYSSINEIRPPHLLLQAFPEADAEELFHRHMQSVRFLQTQGFAIENTPLYNFRSDFLEEFLETGRKMKTLTAPFKLIYLMYFGSKNRFTKTIQEQVLANQLRLPQ